ncbi:hypothetical protein [Sorangium cellulosum]|uniref:hypothetical protein n=1 Tax=Sorangium cellulosum TaxID=56 RepID=UPI001F256540|nr:hypothetical protein [Sorangium cellulosum]
MAAAVVVCSRAALAAGEAPHAPATARSEAEEAFAWGEKARRAGRWEEAEASYRAAWEADPRPEFAGELGLAELALGRFKDAAEHLRASLLDRETLAPPARRRFMEGFQRAESKVSSATISVSRPEAEVLVDGRRIGRGQASYFVYLDPGRHEARGRLEGYVEDAYPFEAQRGRESVVGLHLEPKPPPAVAPVVPVTAAAAPAAQGGMPAGTMFRIGWFALASAGVAIGAGLSIAAAVRDGDADAQANRIRRRGGPFACAEKDYVVDCTALRHTNDARDTLETAAAASFVSAGVVAAIAVSSFWWAPVPDKSPVRAAPVATAQLRGVVVSGSW